VRRRRSGPQQAALFELEEDLYAQERGAWGRGLWVAGVDEVGRGPLAGPVVAAAVILDPTAPVDGLRDSKLLTGRQRRRLAREIQARALAFGVGQVGPRRIDTVNVLQATWSAMRAALERLRVPPGLILVDGRLRIPGVMCAQRAIISGDRRSASVAAASILAKVVRDAFMTRADQRYPEYGFRQHKGYATAAHLEVLGRLGPCPLHRRSFHGVGSVAGEILVASSPELPL
jgi:ribonuclease HII